MAGKHLTPAGPYVNGTNGSDFPGLDLHFRVVLS
jgi:hypothetical protein